MYRWIFLGLILLVSIDRTYGDEPLVLGVHPYLPPIELIERFTPLAKYLERELDQPVVVRVGTSYKSHNDSISRGGVDLAFIGPANYVRLRLDGYEFHEALRLGFSGKTRFRGAIITSNTSGIERLDQVKDHRMALGDPNSTLSTLVPLHMLSEAGVDIFSLGKRKHLRNHHNVALGILVGKYDIGGVKEEVYREFESRGLVRIAYTEWFPSHLFVVNPSLPAEVRSRIRAALLNLANEEGGVKILARIKKGTTELVDNNDHEFDSLMEIVRQSRNKKWLE